MPTADGKSAEPVIFGVRLIARSVAEDWERVTHLYSAMLGSLFAQTSQNFRVVVAGTDRPDVQIPLDERFQFIRCPEPAGSDIDSLHADIRNKRLSIATRARALGGGYLMFVDADDLVSSKLVSFIDANPHPHGYLVAEGYVFNAVSGEIAPYPLPGFEKYPFDRVCGTSAIVRLSADELPYSEAGVSLYQRIFGMGHVKVRRRSFDEGRPLAKLPFRAVAYVRADRMHMSFRADQSDFVHAFYTRLVQRIPLHAIERTPELDLEFNLRAACLSALPEIRRSNVLSGSP